MGLPHYTAPRDDDLDAPFWTAIDEGHIELPRCTVCERWQWYPDDAGTDCPGGSLRWEAVALTGTVYSMTWVERPFLPVGGEDVPYVVGFVELDGVDGVRLVANIVDDGVVRVGSRVRASFVDLGDRRHLLFANEED
ncbi:MAG TPA: OB-fold domain-containing protein [Acidimicrobiales bacterium]|jgi:hypothetical protein|nr:OB-fold domain-containing protein [Acidimicrobiales bacterium]